MLALALATLCVPEVRHGGRSLLLRLEQLIKPSEAVFNWTVTRYDSSPDACIKSQERFQTRKKEKV